MTSRFASLRNRSFGAALLALCSLPLAPVASLAHAESPKPAAATAQPAAVPAADGVININTATAQELDRLPGVGPSRAEAIVALRTKMKHFEHLEDVMRVKGIGRATFRKLRPLLRLDGATTLVEKHAHAPRPAHPAAG